MWKVRSKKRAVIASLGNTQKFFFAALILVVFAIAARIFLPYIGALFLGLILSIIFRPMHNYIVVRTGNRTVASFVSTLVVLLLIILPLIIFGILLFNEVYSFYSNGDFSVSGYAWFKSINSDFSHFFARVSPNFSFDADAFVGKVVNWFVSNLSSFFSKFFDAILSLFIALLTLFYLFRDGSHALKKIMFLSPLSDQYDEEIFKKIEQAINSVVRGSLVVALIQGLLSGIGFLIFGLPHPVLWASVTMLASLVPNVGTALVLIPSVAFLYFTGHTGSAVGLIIWGSIGVGFIDNLVGPHLIERGIKIHPLLILLSVIGGITLLGPIGFIAGPVILSLLFTLLEIYPSILSRKYR